MTVNKNVPWLVTGFLTLLLWLQTCRLNNKIEEGEKQITQLELDKQELTTTVNKQGKTIQMQDVIIVNNTQALDNLTDSIFDLNKKDAKNRETIAYYKGVTKTEIVRVSVPYVDSLAIKNWEDSVKANCQKVIDYYEGNSISVPRTAQDSNANYSLSATIRKDSLVVDHLSIPDTLQLRFLQHKRGWLASDQIEVQFFHSNPLVKSTQANSVFYKPKKKSFFQRVILPVAVGVGIGIIINK